MVPDPRNQRTRSRPFDIALTSATGAGVADAGRLVLVRLESTVDEPDVVDTDFFGGAVSLTGVDEL